MKLYLCILSGDAYDPVHSIGDMSRLTLHLTLDDAKKERKTRGADAETILELETDPDIFSVKQVYKG